MRSGRLRTARAVAAPGVDRRDQRADVRGALDEGEGQDIRLGGHGVERGEVRLRQCRDIEFLARDRHALVGFDLRALVADARDLDEGDLARARDDRAAHPSVVDPDRRARNEVGEEFGVAQPVAVLAVLPAGARREFEPVAPAHLPARRLDAAQAHLRAADVHRDRHPPAGRRGGEADVGDHRAPRLRPVMGAVDPEAVHPGVDEAADEGGIPGRLGRERRHDPGRAARHTGAEHRVAPPGEVRRTLGEGLRRREVRRAGVAGDPGEGGRHGIEAGADMGLAAPERRQSECGEAGLERAQVRLAECEVVGEVARRCREGLPRGQVPPSLEAAQGGRLDAGTQRGQLRKEGSGLGHGPQAGRGRWVAGVGHRSLPNLTMQRFGNAFRAASR